MGDRKGALTAKNIIEVFGSSYKKILAFHELIVQEGELRGLIGPREVPRIWERHILNSAVLAQFIDVSRETLAQNNKALLTTETPNIRPETQTIVSRETLVTNSHVVHEANIANIHPGAQKSVSQEMPAQDSATTNMTKDTDAQPETSDIVSRETCRDKNDKHENLSTTVQEGSALQASKVLVDVGSGAGFPGLILACMLPELEVYLVESMQRRVDWLLHAADKIDLPNVHVVHTRAEDAQKTGAVPPADYVTARAVAPLKRLLGWTMPFLKPGGELIALKGSSVQSEIQEASKMMKRFTKNTPEIVQAQVLPDVESTTVLRLKK